MSRRLMYLQYLLQEDENSLLNKFFIAQLENPVQGDWTNQVKKDINEVALDTSMEEIKMMSKETFKEIVKASISKAAFIYLTDEKEKLSKIMNVSHNDVNLQPYFNPMSMDVDEAKFLFLLRSRMVEVKTNFRNKYSDVLCPVCKLSDDTQQHLFECSELLKNMNILISNDIQYSHIFSENTDKQKAALRLFKSMWKEREKILKDSEN